MIIKHNSREIRYKEPYGAVPCKTRVRLCFEVEEGDNLWQIPLTLKWEACYEKDSITVIPSEVNGNFITYYLEEDALSRPGTYFYSLPESDEKQLTVYRQDLEVPEWFYDAIIYQIFPDRFYRGEGPCEFKKDSFIYATWQDTPMYIRNEDNEVVRWDFYAGNLWGVAEKLDYIKSLGANVIYLNPIFKAISNHRYDTEDYTKVDEVLGGETAFSHLLSEAKKENIGIMLDGVFSHTGNDSIYFDMYNRYGGGAYHNEDSPYRNWYRFREDGTYDCWWDIAAVPNVNELEPSYLDFIVRNEDSVIKTRCTQGICGWRLDVADELPSEFLRELRKATNEDQVILGEVWEDASNKVSYDERRTYFTEKELHTVTNYVFHDNLLKFLKGEITSGQLTEVFESLKENVPKHNFYSLVNMTGTHDIKRLATECGDRDMVKAFSLVQFTFPGVPLVYYGDETMLEGLTDPDNRRPMPWTSLDEDSIKWFADMASMRKSDKVFTRGDITFVDMENDDVFAYKRTTDNKEIMVIIDRIHTGIEYFDKKVYSVLVSAGNWGYVIEK